MATTRPIQVYLAAAKVGGIHANSTQPADFLHDNLAIQTNVIEGSRRAGVDKLLFLGSSCIYPKHAPQPIPEDALMTGELEPTNAPYAIAKIAGLHMCDAYRAQHGCNYISAMPTNLYGPGDNYHPEHSHVLPAMIRRFHEAKQARLPAVTCWGTGQPMREFLHVDDLASACLHLMDVHNEPGWVNVGTGSDLSIANLAHMVAQTVDFKGQILWDRSKPDGTPRKWLDVSRLAKLDGHRASPSKRDFEPRTRISWLPTCPTPCDAEFHEHVLSLVRLGRCLAVVRSPHKDVGIDHHGLDRVGPFRGTSGHWVSRARGNLAHLPNDLACGPLAVHPSCGGNPSTER